MQCTNLHINSILHFETVFSKIINSLQTFIKQLEQNKKPFFHRQIKVVSLVANQICSQKFRVLKKSLNVVRKDWRFWQQNLNVPRNVLGFSQQNLNVVCIILGFWQKNVNVVSKILGLWQLNFNVLSNVLGLDNKAWTFFAKF